MSETDLLPLERIFKAKAVNKHELPDDRDKLFSRYEAILGYLNTKVYPFIDAGLATLSKENGIYTLHNKDHFDEVVIYAGQLLGCFSGNETFDDLNAYELFVLLVAIRVHDAGNMFGREKHEQRTYQILKETGPAAITDLTEARFIADIARAHGGKVDDGTEKGNKDTIGQLGNTDDYGKVTFHPRIIAAIVRFADEICEGRGRGAEILLSAGLISTENEVYHKYATCIKSVRVTPTDPNGKKYICPSEVRLRFEVNADDCLRKWGKVEDEKTIEVFLIDEIFARLEKMMLERRYCNHFMRDICNVVGIDAKITIFEEIDNGGIIVQEKIREIPVIEKGGYPTLPPHFLSKMCGIDGEHLKDELLGRRK